MAYRLDPSEAPSYELRRIAREQVGNALADLVERDLRSGAHEARKRFKKIRALLRLFRPQLGDRYREENIRFRDAGRSLAPVRDATTRIEALDAIEEWAQESFDAVREGLNNRREQVERQTAREDAVGRMLTSLQTALPEIEAWSLEGTDFARPGGADKTYRRSRKAVRKARKNPSGKPLHEWRKRTKYHRYHCRLLEGSWRRPYKAREQEAHDLTDLLGEHHDLAELTAAVREEPDCFGGSESVDRLARQAARRQAELEGEAFRLGSKLFAEKPRALERRMAAYWRAARG